MKTVIPEGYKSILSIYDTQKAISLLKRLFEDRLGALLNLYRVSAPLFVEKSSGLNDNLNGVERPVGFDILRSDKHAEVVQSLAKWKRLALKRYGFYPGKGLYTDMNAIRRDEDELDNLHSVYVDQWDWEKVILPENRNLDYLKSTVMDIVEAICDTQDTMQAIYPQLQSLGKLDRRVSFVTSQQLEDAYPELTPKQRENAYLREHKTAFIIGIGGALRSGQKHRARARERNGVPVAREQRHAELPLKGSHGAAGRRVADKELLGRACEAAAGSDGAEDAQLFQFHGAPFNN